MQHYCESLTAYRRLRTLEVKIGDLTMGGDNPIRVQTMTTTDTMDTAATVAQTIRCIEAGAELVRITAPSKKEAENLRVIREELHRKGYRTPLVADIHFTPNAAEIAARIVEKVRINPGNYVDKKKFEFIEYTDAQYMEEIDRIRERFLPLVRICRENGTAMRIGTNHGSLSDRIMSRYGDTPMGMVESAMEFLRIAREESFHNIVLSMKSSNPQVMVQAYRLLVKTMQEELGVCYPLHLGVTEAGDGEDGRIKSAIGIGTLLEDGIGDTVRVSLTEDPEFEIPVCRDLVKRYAGRGVGKETERANPSIPEIASLPWSPYEYRRRETLSVGNIGGRNVPVVVADFSGHGDLEHGSLHSIGYRYDPDTDKWNIGDAAADYIYTGGKVPDFALPGTLKVLCDYIAWESVKSDDKFSPLLSMEQYLDLLNRPSGMHMVLFDAARSEAWPSLISALREDEDAVLCVQTSHPHAMPSIRRFVAELMAHGVTTPVVVRVESSEQTVDEQLIHFSAEAGGLFLEGMGDGLWIGNGDRRMENVKVSGRTYLEVKDNRQFLNNTAFSILQAARTRISKTEYISCPSCGRTLFDLQETTAKIRAVTHHLKGVKIAIMGCIVNGPGEMADADFGYVGSGPGKITLYKGKDIVKRAVDSDVAVDELIQLLKDNGAWVEP
jgi:(E)-4-hydroxy-3-methylbut-2-enyl-diphosphate synthase